MDRLLLEASRRQDLETIKQLLRENAPVNTTDSSGNTPLIYAVQSENLEIAKYLLEHNAIPNMINDDGMSPLHFAVQKENSALYKLLLEHEAIVTPSVVELGYRLENGLTKFKEKVVPDYAPVNSPITVWVKGKFSPGTKAFFGEIPATILKIDSKKIEILTPKWPSEGKVILKINDQEFDFRFVSLEEWNQ